MRYFIRLSYRGTNFHGWQYQTNAISIQEVLEKAFTLLLKNEIKVYGAGRTDAGVHAINYIAHINVNEEITDIPRLIFKANNFISKDIVIHKIFKVKDDAHARFSAISRTYEYRFHTYKNPFIKDQSFQTFTKLDFKKMNEAAQVLFDFIDFTSFSKLHTDTKTNNCKIIQANFTERNEQIIFTIEANRFLRNMVRAITGTLIEVGKGKLDIQGFKNVIESKDRSNAGVSVPARGLFLIEIKYPQRIEMT